MHPASSENETNRVLVVLVNTLAGPTVFDHLYNSALKQQTEFHVVMPVLPPDYGLAWTKAQARKDAQDRLEIFLEFMERAGLTSTGELASEDDPARALVAAAKGPKGPFDRVVVAWRGKKYRWLYEGDRERLEQDLGIPIESCQADPPVKQSKVDDPEALRVLFQQHGESKGWLRTT